jgi:hypothetical protein
VYNEGMRARLYGVAVVLGIIYLWFQVLIWLPQHWGLPDQMRDLSLYYHAASQLGAHRPIYLTIPPGYGPQTAPCSYIYPPFLAAALLPFRGHFHAYAVFWYSLIVASCWAYAVLLSRLTCNQWSIGSALIWNLVLVLTPGVFCSPPLSVYWIMTLGNIDPFLWAVFALVIVMLRSDRPNYAGAQVLLALISLFKPYALFPWLVVASRRPLREAAAAVSILILSTVGTVWLGGIRPFADWVHDAVPMAQQGTFGINNFSVSFAVLRILHGLGIWHFTSGPLASGPRLFLSMCALAGPITAAYLTRRSSMPVQVVGVYMAAMLFSPLCWQTYVVTAYIVMGMALGRFNRNALGTDQKSELMELKSFG